jgi:hypothetical protein
MEGNIADLIETLTKKQKAVLFWCISRQAGEGLRKQFHKGMFPLIKRETALHCVLAEAASGNKTRLVKELIGRLSVTDHVTFKMYLDDARMSKVFGRTFEKGRRLSSSPSKVKTKIQGSDKRWVTLDHTCSAKFISHGLWEITCARSQYDYVNSWLLRLCSPQRIPLKLNVR